MKYFYNYSCISYLYIFIYNIVFKKRMKLKSMKNKKFNNKINIFELRLNLYYSKF
jgi:hypothetical protein